MQINERKAWEKTQRKNRIIKIAERVFHQHGFQGTTLPAIAAAAGYNRRTLYLYFRDKEELFLAVVLRSLESLGAYFQKAATGANVLRELAWAFFTFAQEHPEDLDLIMRYESGHFNYWSRQNRTRTSGEYQTACQRVSETIMKIVTTAIADGMKSNTIHTTLTPRQLMLILWGQIFGVVQVLRMREAHFEEAFGADHHILFDHFVGMIEAGLQNQTAPLTHRAPRDMDR